MDIAKIRKKAQARDQEAEGPEKETAVAPEPPPERPGPDDAGASEQGATAEPSAEVSAPPRGPKTEPVAPKASAPVAQPTEAPPAEADYERERGTEEVLELLTFALGNEEFAFRVSEVEEIIRYQKITKVPTMPEFVKGITSLRGKIIPVVDLKSRLALVRSGAEGSSRETAEGPLDQGKILILSGPKGLIGATIDRILGVVRMPGGSILAAPGHLSEGEREFLEGVVVLEKRFISIIRSEDALSVGA
jgi:purine-binding chemotaxis protein CheW